jgi:hypothetical protein
VEALSAADLQRVVPGWSTEARIAARQRGDELVGGGADVVRLVTGHRELHTVREDTLPARAAVRPVGREDDGLVTRKLAPVGWDTDPEQVAFRIRGVR